MHASLSFVMLHRPHIHRICPINVLAVSVATGSGNKEAGIANHTLW